MANQLKNVLDGVWYLKPDMIYDYEKSYFENYRKLDRTTMGKALTQGRVWTAERFGANPNSTVDIGIGGGAFVQAFKCKGTDVNKLALDFLIRKMAHWDGTVVQTMTFWDAFEHLTTEQQQWYLDRCRTYAIMTIPVFTDEADILASKHFKPNEHLWYFTNAGIKLYMRGFQFECIGETGFEQEFGRHNVRTFIFKKIYK